MKTIKIAGRDVSLKTIERYITHLHKANTPGGIGDAQTYEWVRVNLHNNIFLMAGFENVRGRARVEFQDSDFANELSTLLCDVMGCPKEGHGTTDRNGFCFECGKFITAKDSIRMLKKLAKEQER